MGQVGNGNKHLPYFFVLFRYTKHFFLGETSAIEHSTFILGNAGANRDHHGFSRGRVFSCKD